MGAEPGSTLDWQKIALLAGGVAIGAAVGAGAALLFAPRSGAATRHAMIRKGRNAGLRVRDSWDDLRDDVGRARRRGARRLKRRLADIWSARDERC
jgi:gas vesicle protein